MRLVWVHFDCDVPIGEKDGRVSRFHSRDGWTIERLDDGQIAITHDDTGRFVLDGYGYSYAELVEATTAKAPRNRRGA